MSQNPRAVEPTLFNSTPAEYRAWYLAQPRTRRCSEDIENLCWVLAGAAVSVDRMSSVILQQPVEWPRVVPEGCRMPDELIDAAIRTAESAAESAERTVAKLRGIWTDLPTSISADLRGWETELVKQLDRARTDAGTIALILALKKKFGSSVSNDEAQEWRRTLKSHFNPLMEARLTLKAVPPPAANMEAQGNTGGGGAHPNIGGADRDWKDVQGLPLARRDRGEADSPTLDPAILARLEAAVAGLPAVLERNRAGFERVAGAIESLGARDDDDAPAAKIPELKAHDRQAWQLATLHGMTQEKVAMALNKEHGTTYTQGQVSRMIARAKAHAEVNGLAEKVAGPIDRPRAVDPGRLELGERVDKRKPRPSDMARANDDDE